MIGGTYQRTTFDELKAFLQTDSLVFLKLFEGDIFFYGQVFAGGLQVLANSQDFASHIPQVVHCLDNFLWCFSQADHDSGFCLHLAVVRNRLNRFQANLVLGTAPHLGRQPSHRLHIV